MQLALGPDETGRGWGLTPSRGDYPLNRDASVANGGPRNRFLLHPLGRRANRPFSVAAVVDTAPILGAFGVAREAGRRRPLLSTAVAALTFTTGSAAMKATEKVAAHPRRTTPPTVYVTLKPHIESGGDHTERFDALLGDEIICVSRSGWHEPARTLLARGYPPETLLHVQHVGKPHDSEHRSAADRRVGQVDIRGGQEARP